MNEIERAIIDIRNAQKKERRVTLADGTQLSKEWISINTLELAEKLLRSELSRQENAPLTCDGCRWHPIKYDFLGCIISRCENCCRQTILTDRYEPKGEKE